MSSVLSSAKGAVSGMAELVTGKIEKSFDNDDLVVVTQAESSFGAHTVALLSHHDVRVRAVTNDEESAGNLRQALANFAGSQSKRLEVMVCTDLSDVSGCEQLCHDATYMIHTVAMNPSKFTGDAEKEMLKPSIEGTHSILEAARRCKKMKKVCIVSSIYALGDVYKERGKKFTDESWYDISRPEAAKLSDVHELFQACNALGEKAAWNYHRSLPDHPPFAMTALLPGYVVGPELLSVGPRGPNRMVVDALTGKKVCKLADMGFVDARDVAQACVNCLHQPSSDNKRYALSAGHFQYKDMVPWVSSMAGIQPAKEVMEEGGPEEANKIETRSAESDLGIKYTPIEKSITEMLAQTALHETKQTAGEQPTGEQQSGEQQPQQQQQPEQQ